jgi:hypothetical protein
MPLKNSDEKRRDKDKIKLVVESYKNGERDMKSAATTTENWTKEITSTAGMFAKEFSNHSIEDHQMSHLGKDHTGVK